jgi:hypothetical protein
MIENAGIPACGVHTIKEGIGDIGRQRRRDKPHGSPLLEATADRKVRERKWFVESENLRAGLVSLTFIAPAWGGLRPRTVPRMMAA